MSVDSLSRLLIESSDDNGLLAKLFCGPLLWASFVGLFCRPLFDPFKALLQGPLSDESTEHGRDRNSINYECQDFHFVGLFCGPLFNPFEALLQGPLSDQFTEHGGNRT